MDVFSLLRLLADGEFHSGSELGERLGVSRTAIWKSLGKLDALGIEVTSQKGLGYCIEGGLDLLDAQAIHAAISPAVRSRTMIDVFDQISSTNHYLLELPELPEHQYRLCLAEQQLAGRGRRGREWYSPVAQNIYMSMGFRYSGGVEGLAGLSLMVGVACVEALASLGVAGLQLKWPNDIWLDGCKLAGILVELRGEPTTGWQVVVGVGVNVHMKGVDSAVVDQRWAALNQVSELRRNVVAASLIESLVGGLDEFSRAGFAAFAERWRRYDALAGRKIVIQGTEVAGVARGVDPGGALLIETAAGLQAVNAGEVSVRTQ